MPRRTQVPHHRVSFISRTRISRSSSDFPKSFRYKEVLSLTLRVIPMRPYNPAFSGLGSSHFARRYFRNLRRIAPLLDFFSLSYLDGSLHLVWLYYPILFRYRNDDISVAGLPHSAIRESLNVCFSSRLFAAYHGLLRLTAPRHPP